MKIDYDKWCRQCVYMQFDSSLGIICGLTKKKPKFIDSCYRYKADEDKIRSNEYKEKLTEKRDKAKNQNARSLFYEWLYKKKLLLPFFILLSIIVIINFDETKTKSIVVTFLVFLYTIYLLLCTRYVRKNERYIEIKNKRVKNILGPGMIILPSITKYKKVNIEKIAPDLMNSKYDYLLTKRINEYLKHEKFYEDIK